jgi:hypothetical protein
MAPTFSVRLEYGIALRDDESRARKLASILMRDTFIDLDREALRANLTAMAARYT